MKQIIIVIIILANLFSNKTFAQQKKDSCCISNKDIVGIWQRNYSVVGNGLNQNFEFYDDGTFILNLGSDADDIRDVSRLKGKYRLDKDKLYFTITSKTVIEGKIGIADMGISLSIFEIENGKEKEIPESNPQELTDPCYITLFADSHIKINNEVYFKIK